jgi:hypothetical protein
MSDADIILILMGQVLLAVNSLFYDGKVEFEFNLRADVIQ